MNIKITELHDKVQQYLKLTGMNEYDTQVLAELIIEFDCILLLKAFNLAFAAHL